VQPLDPVILEPPTLSSQSEAEDPRTLPDLPPVPDASTDDIPPDSRAIVTTEIADMGGAERSCLALAHWLYRQGIPSHIVCYTDKVGLERFSTDPLSVVQLRPEMTALRKIRSLGRYLRSRTGAPPPLLSGYQTALHASAAGIRGFHTLMHDTPSLFSEASRATPLKNRVKRILSDRMAAHGLRSGGTTIVTSTYLREDCRRTFGVDAAIARMGGLPSTHSFCPHPVTGPLRMLSVSRVETNKRIDWILRALATLEQKPYPMSAEIDWHLDIAGKGSQLAHLQALAKELGIADRVHFQGFVTDTQLQQLYHAADLFLMPAVQGYGIPAIESLARGIPVLLHRDSGVSDILLDTPWATVLRGGEPSLAPALKQAIDSVRHGHHLSAPLPPIPTEDSWAEQVAHLCDWV